MTKHIKVTAGILYRQNQFLIARRQRGTHLENLWEFAGGKLEPGESDEEGLKRELLEELGVEVEVGDFVMEIKHDYPEKSVHLLFYDIKSFTGEPSPLVHDEVRWITIDQINDYEFPPADIPVLKYLRKKLI